MRSLAVGLGKRVEVRNSRTARELRALLAEELRPRIFLFIGHADGARAHAPVHPRLHRRGGRAAKTLPATIADVLSNAPNLELVVFNGCQSAALGKAVVRRGRRAVCWETILDDEAAALFTPALFGQLFHPDNANVEMSWLIPKAFDQAKLAITTEAWPSGKDKFAIDDPEKYYGTPSWTDPSDGEAYTYSEFSREYGGADEWDAAVPTGDTKKETHGELNDGSGRRAAGVPLLPEIIDGVPNLPEQYERRPALEAKYRAALLRTGVMAITAATTGVSARRGRQDDDGHLPRARPRRAGSLLRRRHVAALRPRAHGRRGVGALAARLGVAAAPGIELTVAISRALARQRRLLVLDDVWTEEQLSAFKALTAEGGLLGRLRGDALRRAGGREQAEDGPTAGDEALRVLANYIGGDEGRDAEGAPQAPRPTGTAVRAIAAMQAQAQAQASERQPEGGARDPAWRTRVKLVRTLHRRTVRVACTAWRRSSSTPRGARSTSERGGAVAATARYLEGRRLQGAHGVAVRHALRRTRSPSWARSSRGGARCSPRWERTRRCRSRWWASCGERMSSTCTGGGA